MATTRIMSIHIGKGKTPRQSIGERLDYIMNPEKTDGGLLISTHVEINSERPVIRVFPCPN